MTPSLRDLVFAHLDAAVRAERFVNSTTAADVAVDFLEHDSEVSELYPEAAISDVVPFVEEWRAKS